MNKLYKSTKTFDVIKRKPNKIVIIIHIFIAAADLCCLYFNAKHIHKLLHRGKFRTSIYRRRLTGIFTITQTFAGKLARFPHAEMLWPQFMHYTFSERLSLNKFHLMMRSNSVGKIYWICADLIMMVAYLYWLYSENAGVYAIWQ